MVIGDEVSSMVQNRVYKNNFSQHHSSQETVQEDDEYGLDGVQNDIAAHKWTKHEGLSSESENNQQQDNVDVLDEVLSDIESTLLTNAQEYVSSYVQKGGQ